MTETQKVLFGMSIASIAVIYQTLQNDTIGKLDLISAAVTLILIAIIGYWLYTKASNSEVHTDTSTTEETTVKLECIYNTGQGALILKDKEIKEAHHNLVNHIIFGGDKSGFHTLIDKHNIPKRGEPAYIDRNRHFSYLLLLNEAYAELSYHFFTNLDWKEGVSDFRWHLEEALKGTPYQPNFPKDDKYPDSASILYGLDFNDPDAIFSEVFFDYIKALNDVGLGLAFLETNADYFLVFMYKRTDKRMVQKYIAEAGLFFGSTK